MSKKLNSSFGSSKNVASPKNNLFNYFSKSPATLEKKKIPATHSSSGVRKDQQNDHEIKENLLNKQNKVTSPKEKVLQKIKIQDSDDEEIAAVTKKRRRLVLQDSDDEEVEEKQQTKSKAKDEDDSDYEPSKDEEMPSEDEADKQDSSPETSPDNKNKHVSYFISVNNEFL